MKSEPTTPPFTLRPVCPEDEQFLFTLYASTRYEELAPLDWGEAQRTVFLRVQFAAQQRDYAARFSAANDRLVLVDDTPVGRFWVERSADEVFGVDMALLPAARNYGIGTRLLKDLIAEARATGRTFRFSVLKQNVKARRLYERLGFVIIGDRGTHFRMEYQGQ